MFPIDVDEVIKQSLQSERRVDDGFLHCSSDLIGSLRHTQLRIAGAPTMEGESSLLSTIRMHTGTMWHSYIGTSLVKIGLPIMQEISVTPWLPKGWSGIADWMVWNPDSKAWVLGDLKTTKGEAIKWIVEGGVKEEHRWQVSAYYWALVDAGFPMHDRFVIYYLPMNDTANRGEKITPVTAEVTPIDRDVLEIRMKRRYTRVQEYVSSLGMLLREDEYTEEVNYSELYINSELESTMAREQKVYWNAKQGVFDVKLVPHWTTRFCPYPLELCDCSEQKSEKIGHYEVSETWVPRAGYDTEIPDVEPSEKEYDRRRKEV